MNKIRIGDLFEISTPKGKAYFQYVFELNGIGSLIRVFDGLFDTVPEKLYEIVNNEEKFFVYFPLKYALKYNVVRKVLSSNVPGSVQIPKKMRTPNVDKNGKILFWHIVDVETLQREVVYNLNDLQKNFSPWGVWNDTILIERLSSGWTLENWG